MKTILVLTNFYIKQKMLLYMQLNFVGRHSMNAKITIIGIAPGH